MDKKQLEYYCLSISELFNIPIFTFRKDSGEMEISEQLLGLYNIPFLYDERIVSFYNGKNLFNISEMVSYYISDDDLAFGCISDRSGNYCVYIGPCLLKELNEEDVREIYNLAY